MTNQQRKALMDSAESHLAAAARAMDDLNDIFSALIEAESASEMAKAFSERIIADVRTRLISACRAHDAAYESYAAARAIVFFWSSP